MPINSRAVTVATTATRLDAAEETDRPGQSVSVHNAGSASVYLGPAGVTTANGYPLAAGEHLAIDISRAEPLYGICAAGTVDVRVLETGV